MPLETVMVTAYVPAMAAGPLATDCRSVAATAAMDTSTPLEQHPPSNNRLITGYERHFALMPADSEVALHRRQPLTA